ncbi:type II toxin-antitoxin system CcdA family antitoxin [Nocardioides nitrophenolicus]|uniref:type II toxin-antitoxin system CcdA family antitoxin n=1 Tax=Nocardioides nitrophenolicus TaxID=60489 RepID=UPI00195808AE|nr:type II toxin-antitoxin system CcdA family antitoxin [Nocardioides nitrophenolicus]MBM7516709.1 post-segregation antitoxin (ccd killing protein) [Nocardioides nitrophenolicus]
MPKVNIYVPDALYDELRRTELPISSIAQQAFRDALDARANADWIAAARARAPRTSHLVDTTALMDEVRGEFGA